MLNSSSPSSFHLLPHHNQHHHPAPHSHSHAHNFFNQHDYKNMSAEKMLAAEKLEKERRKHEKKENNAMLAAQLIHTYKLCSPQPNYLSSPYRQLRRRDVVAKLKQAFDSGNYSDIDTVFNSTTFYEQDIVKFYKKEGEALLNEALNVARSATPLCYLVDNSPSSLLIEVLKKNDYAVVTNFLHTETFRLIHHSSPILLTATSSSSSSSSSATSPQPNHHDNHTPISTNGAASSESSSAASSSSSSNGVMVDETHRIRVDKIIKLAEIFHSSSASAENNNTNIHNNNGNQHNTTNNKKEAIAFLKRMESRGTIHRLLIKLLYDHIKIN